MSSFLVLPVRFAEDAAIGRYAVQAAHGREGLTVVLDLAQAPAGLVDADFVAEVAGTARGNGQRFALVWPEGTEELLGFDGPSVTDGGARVVHADLESCLGALAESGRTFRLGLTLPSRIEYLPAVRRHHGEADAFAVEILVDELCLNAVENSPSNRSSYEVSVRCEGDELTLEVTNEFDDSIDSARIMHRRLESFDESGDYLGERGRGLFLIARVADGLQIRPLEDGRIRVSVARRLGRERKVTD